jgi:hypothetical protein
VKRGEQKELIRCKGVDRCRCDIFIDKHTLGSSLNRLCRRLDDWKETRR